MRKNNVYKNFRKYISKNIALRFTKIFVNFLINILNYFSNDRIFFIFWLLNFTCLRNLITKHILYLSFLNSRKSEKSGNEQKITKISCSCFLRFAKKKPITTITRLKIKIPKRIKSLTFFSV